MKPSHYSIFNGVTYKTLYYAEASIEAMARVRMRVNQAWQNHLPGTIDNLGAGEFRLLKNVAGSTDSLNAIRFYHDGPVFEHVEFVVHRDDETVRKYQPIFHEKPLPLKALLILKSRNFVWNGRSCQRVSKK